MGRLLAPLALAGLALAHSTGLALAADTAAPLARIGEEAIAPADLDAYIAGLPEADRQLARSDRGRSVLLEELINRRLLVGAARERGLPREAAIRHAMRRTRQDVLIEALLRRVVRERVTDARIRDYYRQRIVGSAVPVLHLRHIRMDTEEAATGLREQLQGGADFAALARANAADGGDGDRGWAPLVTLPPPLREALGKARPGQVVGPVGTDQGWLLVRVRDRRDGEAPPLGRVRGAIRRALERRAIHEMIADLRDGSEVRYPERR